MRRKAPERVALERDELLALYQKMVLIRLFEEAVNDLFARGMIHGTTHLYIGEEAVAVGACAALEPDDYITSTHRGHGHCLAKGADPRRMMAELFGKVDGYCRGKGGSMHIADVEVGNLGANGIVGAGLPIAVGAGLALKMQRRRQVVLCFFGDGGVAQGVFHESLNLAALWRVPVVFVCENNQYAMSLAVSRALSCADFALRAAAYGVPGQSVDGNDVLAVHAATRKAVERARAGQGPTLLECRTYRFMGHSKSDANLYRTREEIIEWRKRDPLDNFAQTLREMGILDETLAGRIRSGAEAEIQEAIRFAQESAEPGLEELLRDIYA